MQAAFAFCGSQPAGDGGLRADQSLAGCMQSLWELACQRWRPDSRPVSCRLHAIPVGAGCQRWRPGSRPVSCRVHVIPVGAGLPAMAACQPTSFLQTACNPCGSWLPAMAAWQPTSFLQSACNPCGSWLASDGGLPADQSLAEHVIPVGASLVRAAIRRKRSARAQQTNSQTAGLLVHKRNSASAFKVHEPLRHKGYNTLRRCLRVRQNPPAYAAWRGLYRFPVTEK